MNNAEDIQRKREMPFAELYERSKDDRAIIVGSEVREVIGAYRRCLQRLDREPAAPALPAVEESETQKACEMVENETGITAGYLWKHWKLQTLAGSLHYQVRLARRLIHSEAELSRLRQQKPDDKDAIIGQLREEIALTKADLSDLQDGCDRGHAELVKQAETIGQLQEQLGECYILSGADPDKDADEPWRLAPYAVREVKRLREESDEEMEQLQKELDLHKRALTHEQTMCNEQAETIRQMTELLREYRSNHLVREVDSCFRWSSADTRCHLCIKADLVLKEPA